MATLYSDKGRVAIHDIFSMENESDKRFKKKLPLHIAIGGSTATRPDFFFSKLDVTALSIIAASVYKSLGFYSPERGFYRSSNARTLCTRLLADCKEK
jgi:hypothetical protein